MIHKAKDLSPEQKVTIESLLGRRILDGEAISVRAIEPPTLSEEEKHELAARLKEYFAEVDARRHAGTADEAEDILTEAIRSSRPQYHPRQ